MKLIGQIICTIFILISFSSPSLSYPDDEQLKNAEDFLNRLDNVEKLDLQYEFKRHIDKYQAASNPKIQSEELEIILGYAVHMEDLEQILYFTDLQAKIGEELNDSTIVEMAKSNLAYSKAISGQFKSALKAITAIEKTAIDSGNLKLRIHTAMLRGLMASYIGRALESIERLKAVERLIIDNSNYDLQRMLIYWTIAFNSVNNNDLTNAMSYYSQSVDIALANQWAIDRQSMIYNIAALLDDENAYSAAENYFREYGKVSLEVKRPQDVFFMHYGLASLYMDQDKYADTYREVQLALKFENIQVDFQPFLHSANTLSLARLGRIEEAKASQKMHQQFFVNNPEYLNTTWALSPINMEAEILRAEGRFSEAYDKFSEYHTRQVEVMNEEHMNDAKGMRQGLEAAIAIEEAENKLAQSEIANSYMLLGASFVILLILFMFYSVQKKSSANLKISKAEADTANQAKSKFLANVSHELRTPLNAIIGFSDIMKNDRVGPMKAEQTKEYSKLINDSGKHLLSIINDILDINKIEAGQMEMNEDAIDISWLLDDVNHLLRQTAMQANIELSFDADSNLPDLYGDERQIKQILINLVNNSIKFSEAETSIRTTAHLREDRGITIKVQDEGYGMSPDDLERAMLPFMRVQNNLKSDKEGTGLGLPLAKVLTELHSGTMTITSVLGQGTSIELNFPSERALAAS